LKYLKSNGGSGFLDDGTIVGQKLTGFLLPLGVALTLNPAADVSGVISVIQATPSYASEGDYASLLPKTFEECVILEKNKDGTRQKKECGVNPLEGVDTQNNMNPEQFQELINSLQTTVASVIEREKREDVVSILSREIEKFSETWTSGFEAEKAAKDKAAEDLASLQKTVAELTEKLGEKDSRVEALEQDRMIREQASTLQARMAWVEEQFNFTPSELDIISSDIASLDTDDAFTAYKDRLNLLFSSKMKSVQESAASQIPAQPSVVPAPVQTPVVEPDPSVAMANAVTVQEVVPTNSPPLNTPSLIEQLTSAWKEEDQIEIK
jgi:hypothetical protein